MIVDIFGHPFDLDNPQSTYFHGDCMEGMAKFPDKYFDLAVVDPPYGLGIDGQKLSISKNPKHSRKEHPNRGWDNDIPNNAYFRELERVSANQIIWGGQYFVRYLQEGHRGWLVWDKGQHGLTMSDCELAYASLDSPTRIKTINRVALLKDGSIHPTQKPVALYRWIFDKFTERGMKILDTHVGSASSLIAAHDAGLTFVGFELDDYYYEKSKQRLDDHMAQMNIFDFLQED